MKIGGMPFSNGGNPYKQYNYHFPSHIGQKYYYKNVKEC